MADDVGALVEQWRKVQEVVNGPSGQQLTDDQKNTIIDLFIQQKVMPSQAWAGADPYQKERFLGNVGVQPAQAAEAAGNVLRAPEDKNLLQRAIDRAGWGVAKTGYGPVADIPLNYIKAMANAVQQPFSLAGELYDTARYDMTGQQRPLPMAGQGAGVGGMGRLPQTGGEVADIAGQMAGFRYGPTAVPMKILKYALSLPNQGFSALRRISDLYGRGLAGARQENAMWEMGMRPGGPKALPARGGTGGAWEMGPGTGTPPASGTGFQYPPWVRQPRPAQQPTPPPRSPAAAAPEVVEYPKPPARAPRSQPTPTQLGPPAPNGPPNVIQGPNGEWFVDPNW